MRAASTACYYGLLVAFAQALRAPAPGASVRLGARRGAPRFGARRVALGAYAAPAPELALPGDTLETLPGHVAAAGGCAALTLACVARDASMLPAGAAAASLAFGLLAAELFSGVFHWATDNYGSLETPVFGPACAAFQGHHGAPWTITYRSTANNVHKIARAVAPLVCLSQLLPPFLALAASVMFFGQVCAQEAHKWSHVPPSEQPGAVQFLQTRGLALSVREHGLHHSNPYGAHYCILFGALNPWLDRSNVFRRLERFFYERTGVEPNCWKDGPRGAALREIALGRLEVARVEGAAPPVAVVDDVAEAAGDAAAEPRRAAALARSR